MPTLDTIEEAVQRLYELRVASLEVKDQSGRTIAFLVRPEAHQGFSLLPQPPQRRRAKQKLSKRQRDAAKHERLRGATQHPPA